MPVPTSTRICSRAGIIDPTKVARVALENAASIAAMFLTTECVLVDKKEENWLRPCRRAWVEWAA